MSWICPNCSTPCKTPESYGIHVKRCRAMSEQEIFDLIAGKCVSDESARAGAKAIHAFQIQKLRGKRR